MAPGSGEPGAMFRTHTHRAGGSGACTHRNADQAKPFLGSNLAFEAMGNPPQPPPVRPNMVSRTFCFERAEECDLMADSLDGEAERQWRLMAEEWREAGETGAYPCDGAERSTVRRVAAPSRSPSPD